jgi:hypothetical protein
MLCVDSKKESPHLFEFSMMEEFLQLVSLIKQYSKNFDSEQHPSPGEAHLIVKFHIWKESRLTCLTVLDMVGLANKGKTYLQ